MNNGAGEKSAWWRPRTFLILLIAALVGSTSIFPYAVQLTGVNMAASGVSFGVAWIASTLQTTVLAILAILVGMRLGRGLGLGTKLLNSLLDDEASRSLGFKKMLKWSLPMGAAAAIIIIAIDAAIFSEAIAGFTRSEAVSPPAWMGLMASLYGGIVEELLMRFGLMTFLVWLIVKVVRVEDPMSWPVWAGNIGAALLFGVGHLPATAALGTLTLTLILRALILNGIPGVAFGWLYARFGLLAAMAAHFTADVILHVLLPLVR